MREARIILPKEDKNGQSTYEYRQTFEKALLEYFGGFTASHTYGAWIDGKGRIVYDNGVAYHVAVADTEEFALRELARTAAIDLNQDAIYLRNSRGNVLLIGPSDSGVRKRTVEDQGYSLEDVNVTP